jgi:DNA-binding CsgD family transcriptional regulator/tetratricopeptide (TPR) repeat protein
MPKQFASRTADAVAVADFLASAHQDASALVVEGEAGIGKTTLWLDSCEQARERGFAVLSARAAATESVLAYGSLADLLGGVDAAGWTDLPEPQRLAVDRILLRAPADGLATDQRAVAAAFLSVVEGLAEQAPVLVAIDDLQWLDPSSMYAVAFAARRLSGRVGVLCTVRTDSDSGDAASWLQLPKPDTIRRIVLGPLSVGDLHAVVSERFGRSFPRPAMVRIHQVSGGNPFYGIELARAFDVPSPGADGPLPGTLVDLVRARVGSLDPDLQSALLATACLAAPTVELVAGAANIDAKQVVKLLEDAEAKGIVGIVGNRLRFAHPLLARGVYTDAPPGQRRAMHRRCAMLVEQPELQARHLALAATTADPLTLESLDAAAETARVRGAPAAAAELLELAVGLGGDTPLRRIRLASRHFDAGEPERARALLEETIGQLTPGALRAEALHLLAVVRLYDDSFLEAAALLERGLGETGDDLALRVQVLVTLSFALVNAGQLGAAVQTVEDAVTNATGHGQRDLLSQALGMRVVLRFMRGDGLDEPSLRRALELEDRQATVPLALRPGVQNALLLAWTGQLEQAHQQMLAIRRRCIEHGEEGELIFVAFHSVLIEIWRGNFTDAPLIAEDAMERALQLGGDFPLFVALTMQAGLAAYAGREHQARRDIGEALAASQRCGSYRLAEWPIATLGFLDVSLGNYDAALATLEPLLAHLEAAPNGTEIIAATFVPDAVEALIHLGRLAEAEPLVTVLERNGRRLDRAWMLAVGARCRAMLLAARGDLEAAAAAAELAMTEHDRLPMPFERARTQLLLGQLQRRQRHKAAASATLREALAVFEALDTPLWADRARAELARGMSGRRRGEGLTPSEQRVAEMAASGMTNKDIAAELFISPKTVEVNLSRIYRKLNIHSRMELYRQFDPPKQ